MEIVKLPGTDRRLYELVAPLVMNPAILRQNNNYPFKTTRNHIWYILLKGEQVVGFMPVKKTDTHDCIDNYFVSGDDSSLIGLLLSQILDDRIPGSCLTAVVHKRHVETFAGKHFCTCIEWKKYNKMQFFQKDEK